MAGAMNKKRQRASFYCVNCGHQEPRWIGRCPSCQEWGTLEETVETDGPDDLVVLSGGQEPTILNQVAVDDSIRLKTGLDEFDRLIGGGVVTGSVVLLVGDPGIGKSTLSLLAAGNVARFGKVLYVSGEESAAQTKIRADRIGSFPDSLYVLAENNLDLIEKQVKELEPLLVVIDSIQSTFVQYLRSTPGSPSQVKESTMRLLKLAKGSNIPILLIGQVTKESELAGPRVLEHLVDVVVYLEGNRNHSLRVARVVKNRFGSTEEVALFEMTAKGLEEVRDPSDYLLENRERSIAGSVIVGTARGSRPLFTEVQALVTETAEGIPPRQIAIGIDRNRLLLVTAVLQRWIGERIGNKNIFVSTAGGIESDDPGLDLGIAASLLSSTQGYAFSGKVFWVGELTLAGEVRATPDLPKLLGEGVRLGFRHCVIARRTLTRVNPIPGIQYHAIDHIRDLKAIAPLVTEKQ
jgi:DNA repair protein RadA/Sms